MNYNEINKIFDAVDYKTDASKVHGYIAGCITANKNIDIYECIDNLKDYTDQETIIDQLEQDLKKIHANIIFNIEKQELSIKLALPDDEQPLQQRIHCVGIWCQAFIDGFYDTISEETQAKLTKDINSLLTDISLTANISDEDCTKEDNYSLKDAEQDLFEIIEFVRMAWISLFLDINK